jgi:hypothetical protein
MAVTLLPSSLTADDQQSLMIERDSYPERPTFRAIPEKGNFVRSPHSRKRIKVESVQGSVNGEPRICMNPRDIRKYITYHMRVRYCFSSSGQTCSSASFLAAVPSTGGCKKKMRLRLRAYQTSFRRRAYDKLQGQ